MIAEGWQPFGSLSYDGRSDFCVQAMVKYEEEDIGDWPR
jgi:hypothetical protein